MAWRKVVYWGLVVAALFVLVAVWCLQVSVGGFAEGRSAAHAGNESEAGSFLWFLMARALQVAFLGWHAVPFALCAGGLVLRREEDLLASPVHRWILGLALVSFALALLLVLVPV